MGNFHIWRKTGLNTTRFNVYGNEYGTGNRDEGGKPWDRVRKLTKALVRAAGKCGEKWGRRSGYWEM